MTNDIRFEIDCDDSTQVRLREKLAPLLARESDARYVQRRNLDGDAATWIVIATLASQAVPHVLKFLTDWRKDRKVGRIKIGDIEIENPTEEDLRMLRQRLGVKDDSNA